MVGRAVVAVVTPRGFLGVCHDEDSEPWNLGNVLLKGILEEEGDLLALTTELVFLSPGGWTSYADRKASFGKVSVFIRRHSSVQKAPAVGNRVVGVRFESIVGVQLFSRRGVFVPHDAIVVICSIRRFFHLSLFSE